MYRIDNPTAVTAMPAPSAAGVEGFFTEGSPTAGQAATIVTADFLNMLQEELRAVVVAAGLTPSKTTFNQLLTALRSAGVFQTPPQFDNDTSVATTEFVKKALGSNSGVNSIATNVTLDGNFIGKANQITGSVSRTLTLVAASSVLGGSAVELMNTTGVSHTVARSGSDSILTPLGVAALTLPPGDSVRLVSNGIDGWNIFGGSIQAKYSSLFAANISSAAGAWEQSPKGKIHQMGRIPNVSNGQQILFPTAFANGILSLNVNIDYGGAFATVMPSSVGLTGFVASHNYSGTVILNYTVEGT